MKCGVHLKYCTFAAMYIALMSTMPELYRRKDRVNRSHSKSRIIRLHKNSRHRSILPLASLLHTGSHLNDRDKSFTSSIPKDSSCIPIQSRRFNPLPLRIRQKSHLYQRSVKLSSISNGRNTEASAPRDDFQAFITKGSLAEMTKTS